MRGVFDAGDPHQRVTWVSGSCRCRPWRRRDSRNAGSTRATSHPRSASTSRRPIGCSTSPASRGERCRTRRRADMEMHGPVALELIGPTAKIGTSNRMPPRDDHPWFGGRVLRRRGAGASSPMQPNSSASGRTRQRCSASCGPTRSSHAALSLARRVQQEILEPRRLGGSPPCCPGSGSSRTAEGNRGGATRTRSTCFRRPGGFVFAPMYGQGDWVKNVLAAGGGDLHTRGRDHHVTNPRIERDPSRAAMPVGVRTILGLLHVDEFMYVDEGCSPFRSPASSPSRARSLRAARRDALGGFLTARHEQHELTGRADDRDGRFRLLHDPSPGRPARGARVRRSSACGSR